MDNLTIYEPRKAVATQNRGNYMISIGDAPPVELRRGVDFDNPTTSHGKKAFSQPILLKAGAEKLAFGFGLCQRYTIESKIEEPGENGFFYYLVRCDLVKPTQDGEYIISNSYGSANTSEKRNGFNTPADAANGTLKMAQKRALVGAALAISGLSDLFTQDIENETFMKLAADITQIRPDDSITTKQIRRIYAIAAERGMNAEQAKRRLAALGYTSTRDIKQRDYDGVCEELAKGDTCENTN